MAPAPVRDALSDLTIGALLDRCAALRPGKLDSPTAAAKHPCACWHAAPQPLRTEAEALEINRLTAVTAPDLLNTFGVGPNCVATLLATAGDNSQRLRSEAAFAALRGASPIPASSGKTDLRRLNRGGDRQANAALHRIVVVRLRWHEPTSGRRPAAQTATVQLRL